MFRANRNFVIAYILLVGFPLLGLVGVLRTGRDLTAPLSVDGTWRIQTDVNQLAAMPCSGSIGSIQDTDVVISQSGKNLILNLDKATASGVIEGTTLTASVQPSVAWARESLCGNDRLLALTATVDAKADPRSLMGVLSDNRCPSCTPVRFHAVRQPRAVRKGVH